MSVQKNTDILQVILHTSNSPHNTVIYILVVPGKHAANHMQHNKENFNDPCFVVYNSCDVYQLEVG